MIDLRNRKTITETLTAHFKEVGLKGDCEKLRRICQVIADEHMRCERIETRKLPNALPQKWVLYENRKDKSESPLEFYERNWRNYELAGLLYQDTLGKLDPKLMPSIRSYCQRNPEFRAADYLPPPGYKRPIEPTELLQAPSSAVERMANRLKKRRQRARAADLVAEGAPAPMK